MKTIYYSLGILFFWTVVLAVSCVAVSAIWEANWFRPARRKLLHLKLAAQLPFTKQPAQYSRTAARYYIATANATGWAGWERNILANILKRARKAGFTKYA